jgi:hypothetical protein
MEKKRRRSKYSLIDWVSPTECPVCNSKKVNDVSNYSDGKEHEDWNSYCMSCGTEWFNKQGEVYKVNWEFVK